MHYLFSSRIRDWKLWRANCKIWALVSQKFNGTSTRPGLVFHTIERSRLSYLIHLSAGQNNKQVGAQYLFMLRKEITKYPDTRACVRGRRRGRADWSLGWMDGSAKAGRSRPSLRPTLLLLWRRWRHGPAAARASPFNQQKVSTY